MDWREGQDYSSLIDCAMRHMLELVDKGPWAKDPDSGDLHIAHAAWNILTLLTFMALGREDLNDVDKWRGVTAKMKKEKEETALHYDGTCDCNEGFKSTGIKEIIESEGIPCD